MQQIRIVKRDIMNRDVQKSSDLTWKCNFEKICIFLVEECYSLRFKAPSLVTAGTDTM